MEVPNPAMNAELQLCISFESNTSSDPIVVLAHHTDNPTKLFAYYSPGNCLRPPTAGNYIFAIFTQNSDNTLEPPATPPEILIRTMSTCKYSCFDPALLIPNLPTFTLHQTFNFSVERINSTACSSLDLVASLMGHQR